MLGGGLGNCGPILATHLDCGSSAISTIFSTLRIEILARLMATAIGHISAFRPFGVARRN